MNLLTHSLSTGISTPPGSAELEKKRPCRCNSHCLFFFVFFLGGGAFLWRCASSLWPLHHGSELILHHFPFIRGIRAAKIFILELNKDGLADLGDEFADRGVDNQLVILQGGVGLSSVGLRVITSFIPTSNGFLKSVTDFLMRF